MNFTFNLELFCVFCDIRRLRRSERTWASKKKTKAREFSRETNGVSIIDIVDIVFAIAISRAVGEKFLHSN